MVKNRSGYFARPNVQSSHYEFGRFSFQVISLLSVVRKLIERIFGIIAHLAFWRFLNLTIPIESQLEQKYSVVGFRIYNSIAYSCNGFVMYILI